MLFLWMDGERTYGFWTGWDDHNYCNATAVGEDGKQEKHRRKTPEPPQELLAQYVSHFKNKLEQVRTKFSIPNPIPIPIPVIDEEEEVRKRELAATKPTPELLFAHYNVHRGPLPEAKALTPERRVKCLKRIDSHAKTPGRYVGDFIAAVQKAAITPFCIRGSTGNSWCNFDWFIANDTNVLKVLEGKYDGRKQTKTEQRSERNTDAVETYLSGMAPGIRGDDPLAGGRAINPRENSLVRTGAERDFSGVP
jgi:hypothetical protein